MVSTAIRKEQLQIICEVPMQHGISISGCRIAHCYSVGNKFRGHSLIYRFFFFLKTDDHWEIIWSGLMSSRAMIKSLLLRGTDKQNGD